MQQDACAAPTAKPGPGTRRSAQANAGWLDEAHEAPGFTPSGLPFLTLALKGGVPPMQPAGSG